LQLQDLLTLQPLARERLKACALCVGELLTQAIDLIVCARRARQRRLRR
jgi:hypothetical protein|tara:strand:+ start:383 stop:529 length:147 start_codon:yes stop_codon:yes gene_type:complete